MEYAHKNLETFLKEQSIQVSLKYLIFLEIFNILEIFRIRSIDILLRIVKYP